MRKASASLARTLQDHPPLPTSPPLHPLASSVEALATLRRTAIARRRLLMKPSGPIPCGENEDVVVEAEEAGNKPKKRSRKREAIRLRWSLLVKQVSSLPL